MAVITIAWSDEWDGVYCDGALIYENHTLSAGHVLRGLAGVTIDRVDEISVDENWLNDRGSLPGRLEDVKIARKEPQP